ncbi:MAG: putative N-acetylmannosamine-6-phosphate epimerase [Clostridiaceae bacterium]|jgi:N-acylglucosamine-6-phosphate 2-epimerase|nr:putative N-acetylmannosamine-6-phosphate epimerase [Clostridiaceae bacterium]
MRSSVEALDKLKGGLIVSCQALEEEPLYSSEIMMRMAKAAQIGGAVGIRANTPQDCLKIKKNVDLPLISIYKKVYGDNDVYITPTIEEIKALLTVNSEIIAVDATARQRPDGRSLEEFIREIRKIYNGLIMADISNYEEAIKAEKLGFDIISTTLSGYTDYTLDSTKPDIELIGKLSEKIRIPIIAEGNIETPGLAVDCLKAGAWCVVVGGAITRPQLITKKFTNAISKLKK